MYNNLPTLADEISTYCKHNLRVTTYNQAKKETLKGLCRAMRNFNINNMDVRFDNDGIFTFNVYYKESNRMMNLYFKVINAATKK
jgi:hypothetical protein